LRCRRLFVLRLRYRVVARAGAVPASSFRVLPPDPLIGKWGVASYRDEKDRPAAEKLARARCASPYAIVKGPTTGR